MYSIFLPWILDAVELEICRYLTFDIASNLMSYDGSEAVMHFVKLQMNCGKRKKRMFVYFFTEAER